MEGPFTLLFLRLARKKEKPVQVQPMLVELLQPAEGGLEELDSYHNGTFLYTIRRDGAGRPTYEIVPDLSPYEIGILRKSIFEVSESLNPASVDPLTFARLIEVLSQAASGPLSGVRDIERVRELSRLAAFEAVGLSTIYALSIDSAVSEFYVDAPGTPVYLDHERHGRCETPIVLTERERDAITTHMDTFRGYTIDYSNPSLKNDFDIFGNKLRLSLDLSPLAVNSFSLDVRKMTSTVLTISDLVVMEVLSAEAASLLLAGLELGLNVTIVGETGTGKTTLLNALDEAMNPQLRRIYIEDAVETKDLLGRGYHQMKLKVDPLERGSEGSRTKSAEIIKILHRSPDLVILGEIQSEEHSRAFFHALSAGVRGLQTFHASSTEQAVRRWREIHGISNANLLDLDLIVQMARPEKLGSMRQVQSIALMVEEEGAPRLRDFYTRGRSGHLERISGWERLQLRKPAVTREMLVAKVTAVQAGIERTLVVRVRGAVG